METLEKKPTLYLPLVSSSTLTYITLSLESQQSWQYCVFYR